MRWLSRWIRLVRVERLNREIDEELESHIAEAIADGRDPAEVRRAFGSMLSLRDRSRDVQVVPWAESLRLDLLVAWRRTLRDRLPSLVVVLSLGLALGATTAAFRLADALLWAPLPVAEADRLHALTFRSSMPDWPSAWDRVSTPFYRQLVAALAPRAEVVAAGPTREVGAQLDGATASESVRIQRISGDGLSRLGLRSAIGRLLEAGDDQPGAARDVAVVSERFWIRRFGGEPSILGRTVRLSGGPVEIVGVVDGRFVGTEPGAPADLFLPMSGERRAESPSRNWLRVFVMPSGGNEPSALLGTIASRWRAFESERWQGVAGYDGAWLDDYLQRTQLALDPAPAGVSGGQRDFRRPVLVVGGLAMMLLLVACANVANLLGGRNLARSRELGLRAAIGAGRLRLVRLLVVESCLLASAAAWIGAVLSTVLVRIVTSRLDVGGQPIELEMAFGGRTFLFCALTGGVVTVLCSLVSIRGALHATPASALRGRFGGRAAGRWMRWMIAAQVAFGFAVVLVAALLVASLSRLQTLDAGFEAEGVAAITVRARPPQPFSRWQERAERLRGLPGVEAVALAEWALLSGSSTSLKVAPIGGAPEATTTEFLCVSPEWAEVYSIPIHAGRNLRADDRFPGPVLVNEAFVARSPPPGPAVGSTFELVESDDRRLPLRVVGVVGDVRQNTLRDVPQPAVYVPCSPGEDAATRDLDRLTFLVRLADPSASGWPRNLSRAVAAGGGFDAVRARMQGEIVLEHSRRERLVSGVANALAGLVLLLCSLGVYSAVHAALQRRRRELCVRSALGASTSQIGSQLTAETLRTVGLGLVAGGLLGRFVGRALENLLFEVRWTDFAIQGTTLGILLGVLVMAMLPVLARARRLDLAEGLRPD